MDRGIKGGFGATVNSKGSSKDSDCPSEFGWCWAEFADKPYLKDKKKDNPGHKIISAFRMNIGHITDVKVFWTYEKIKHDGTLSFLSKCEMARSTSQNSEGPKYKSKDVKDVFACVVANDGYIRIYSLIK